MKSIICIFSLISVTHFLFAQKKTLDLSASERWEYIYDQKISDKGDYLLYVTGSANKGTVLTVESINLSWRRTIKDGDNAFFTRDDNYVVFAIGKDSLGILTLGTEQLEFISGVRSFKIPEKGAGNWLAYLRNDPSPGELILRNLGTSKEEERYSAVTDYYFNDAGDVLLLQQEDSTSAKVLWVSLSSLKRKLVAKGDKNYGNFSFGNDSQLAFVAQQHANDENRKLMYFRPEMNNARIIVDSGTKGMTKDIVICNAKPTFSKDGQRLFFFLMRKDDALDHIAARAKKETVDVWNYKDDYILPQQRKIANLELYRRFTAMTAIGSPGIIQLDTTANDENIKLSNDGESSYALIASKENFWEMHWHKLVRPNIYLLSLKDQSRRTITERQLESSNEYKFSAGGKYVIWYDRIKQNYFVFDTQSGLTKNISQDIKTPLSDDENDLPAPSFSFGIAGWLEKDEAVLIYDRYDIWQVDPRGIKSAVNVTRGYGRINKIMFRYISPAGNLTEGEPVINKEEPLLLAAFDRVTKQNGFFSKKMGTNDYPVKLSMGPYIYYFPYIPGALEAPLALYLPVKAAKAEIYMVQRADAGSAPNLYITSNFKDFTPITDIHPESQYNWLKTELIHWPLPDGRQAEGILYKPENFNPQKKYPVIFTFYEKNADKLNKFINPELCNGPLNIPYFVSNGYLVFVPDIYYKIGAPGESAYNSVVSAANYLTRFPWIDSSRLGMEGHSFGGYEVNYLATRTNLFKAAVAVAGPSDFVSMYGSIRPPVGATNQMMFDVNQCRIGATLWEKPEFYIQNSPVFFAAKVNTPILLVNNEKDEAVPWQQGIEFFTALRRLGKKSWMLQYDGEGHQLVKEKNQMDFSIRLKQFFDYYLKKLPPPEWILNGGILQLNASEK